MTNYNDTEKFLKSEDKFRIKLGLENVERVLELLGNPQERLKIVHVAGTNGKGSVCATAANIFTCAGLKTALYTSPHLFKYTERMKIDGVPISDEVFSANIRQIEAIARENGVKLTEFELLTICAFKYFADEKVVAGHQDVGDDSSVDKGLDDSDKFGYARPQKRQFI